MSRQDRPAPSSLVPADDVVRFFERCGKALKPGGMLLCKENVSAEGFVVDRSDLSITRWAAEDARGDQGPLTRASAKRNRGIASHGLLDRPLSRATHPSACRTHTYYLELAARGGLSLKHTAIQTKFPKGLYKASALIRGLVLCGNAVRLRHHALRPRPAHATSLPPFLAMCR